MITRRLNGTAAVVVGMIVGAAGLAAQTAPAQPELAKVVSQLTVEVKALHLEIRRLQQDLAAERLATLGQELDRVQARRARREAEERGIQEEVAALEQSRKDPLRSDAEQQVLDQAEASRGLQPNSELARVLADKDQLRRAEYEISQKIQQERQRWQQARAAAEFFEAELLRQQPPANRK